MHSLESGLASLHEQLLLAHALLAEVAANVPERVQLGAFLQRRAATIPSARSQHPNGSSGSGSIADESAPVRLQSLLESIRSSAFDLQSLGVLLPSHTAFPHTHLAPPGSERQWNWIFSIQQALKKR